VVEPSIAETLDLILHYWPVTTVNDARREGEGGSEKRPIFMQNKMSQKLRYSLSTTYTTKKPVGI
jgi:hypothetical protein